MTQISNDTLAWNLLGPSPILSSVSYSSEADALEDVTNFRPAKPGFLYDTNLLSGLKQFTLPSSFKWHTLRINISWNATVANKAQVSFNKPVILCVDCEDQGIATFYPPGVPVVLSNVASSVGNVRYCMYVLNESTITSAVLTNTPFDRASFDPSSQLLVYNPNSYMTLNPSFTSFCSPSLVRVLSPLQDLIELTGSTATQTQYLLDDGAVVPPVETSMMTRMMLLLYGTNMILPDFAGYWQTGTGRYGYSPLYVVSVPEPGPDAYYAVYRAPSLYVAVDYRSFAANSPLANHSDIVASSLSLRVTSIDGIPPESFVGAVIPTANISTIIVPSGTRNLSGLAAQSQLVVNAVQLSTLYVTGSATPDLYISLAPAINLGVSSSLSLALSPADIVTPQPEQIVVPYSKLIN